MKRDLPLEAAVDHLEGMTGHDPEYRAKNILRRPWRDSASHNAILCVADLRSSGVTVMVWLQGHCSWGYAVASSKVTKKRVQGILAEIAAERESLGILSVTVMQAWRGTVRRIITENSGCIETSHFSAGSTEYTFLVAGLTAEQIEHAVHAAGCQFVRIEGSRQDE